MTYFFEINFKSQSDLIFFWTDEVPARKSYREKEKAKKEKKHIICETLTRTIEFLVGSPCEHGVCNSARRSVPARWSISDSQCIHPCRLSLFSIIDSSHQFTQESYSRCSACWPISEA